MLLNNSQIFVKKVPVKILLLDDNPELTDHLQGYLPELRGITFSFARVDRESCFKELLQSFKPNVIISDYSLQQYDGTKALDYCKMLYPNVPLIILADGNCDKSPLFFLELGAADFVYKERVETLPAVLYKVLRQNQEKEEIRRAKKQRWEDVQRFKGLIEHSHDPVITYDIEGIVTFASPAITRVLGYTVNEFIGTNVRDHIHPEDLNFREEGFNKLLNKDSIVSVIEEERLLHKNGHYIWVKAIVSDARLAPGIEGFLTNFRDITDSKISEIKLKKTLKDLTDYKEALDESSIVAITDIKGKGTYVNDEFCRISGYSRKELLGSDHMILDSQFHSKSFFVNILKKVLAGVIWKGEIKKKAKDGSFYWVHATIIPFLKSNGKPYQFILVMHDITERKKKAEELRETIEILTGQNERLLNFSYIVSHNLRSHTSNIQSIIGFLENSENEEEKQDMMLHLKSVSRALHETMNNLNEVVTIQSNIGLKVEPLHLQEVISNSLRNLKTQIKDVRAKVINEIPEEIEVSFNMGYLESILHNLLLNSLKYRHPDRNPEIRIFCESKDGHTLLKVSDNGRGIDLDRYKSKLFGMYKTFHGNKDAKGLGLFMSKNQIEALGGKIEVESELGKGTTFTLYIQ